ncbi:MAG: 30S ribosomal protein S12 methylthiotransferase RimO [Clostridiales bacterium]|nr:30S ribosomal protein S12 methylthiotransferase RimO [Clostridiales bacterium]
MGITEKIKIGMVSLGCPKNQVDAEQMLGLLRKEGFDITNDPAGADVIIVNTCGFIEPAKQESIDTILEMAQYKENGRLRALIATGCLAERYRDEVAGQLPELDAVIGIGANGDIVQAVKDALQGARPIRFGEKEALPLTGDRMLTTPPYSAYLRVADGCDNRCTYCAIPLIRGGYRSRPMEEIMEEAKRLAADGVKELCVIAQDTTRYGLNLYGELKLAELLTKLCGIDGIQWIRLLYCYPDFITDELLSVMREQPKIVKYMDLPLQHADGGILRAMNRRGDREGLTKLVGHIRESVPGIALRTTFITGFPGESEEAFEELCTFVREMKFDRMGCFAYSPEEDTPAAVMENQVPEDVKQRRQQLLSEAQAFIMEERGDAQEGKVLRVLCEGIDRESGLCVGRSEADAPEIDAKVLFKAKCPPVPGAFVQVRITGHRDCDLTGEALN